MTRSLSLKALVHSTYMRNESAKMLFASGSNRLLIPSAVTRRRIWRSQNTNSLSKIHHYWWSLVWRISNSFPHSIQQPLFLMLSSASRKSCWKRARMADCFLVARSAFEARLWHLFSRLSSLLVSTVGHKSKIIDTYAMGACCISKHVMKNTAGDELLLVI